MSNDACGYLFTISSMNGTNSISLYFNSTPNIHIWQNKITRTTIVDGQKRQKLHCRPWWRCEQVEYLYINEARAESITHVMPMPL